MFKIDSHKRFHCGDGNCWMTQNLDWDLPIGTGVTIEAANTDLTANQTNLTITGYTNATGVEEWKGASDGGNTALQYYNPGLYVYTTPTEVNNCGAVSDLSKCTSYGWKEYQVGDDEHYLAGNYYSWAAATAGTGNSIASGNANGSICPKNWKLPLSGATNNNTSGSFYKLLTSYGFTFRTEDGNTVSDLVSSTGQNIASAPLYFLRGGFVDGVFLNDAGSGGNLWSRTADSGTSAYRLYFGNTAVIPSISGSRFVGRSIRCLVI